MNVEKIAPFAKGKAKKAIDQMHKYIDAFNKGKGRNPEYLTLSREFFDDIFDKCTAEYSKANAKCHDEDLFLRGIKIRRI